MKVLDNVKRILKSIAVGVIRGVVYYLIYVFVLPFFFITFLRIPIDVQSYVPYLWFFIALNTAVEILRKHPTSIPLNVISRLVAVLILYIALNGGKLETTIYIDSNVTQVSIDLSLALYAIILIGFAPTFVDIFNYFSTITES